MTDLIIKDLRGKQPVKTPLSLITAGILTAFSANASDLVISGVVDASLTGGLPKAVELYVVNDIADLSVYGPVSYTHLTLPTKRIV